MTTTETIQDDGFVAVTCPEGHFAISGGVYNSTADTVIYESRPFGETLNGWRVSARSAEPITLDVYAICMQISMEIETIFPNIDAQGTDVTPTPPDN